ncbi:FecR family protein [Novosphingobium album (ex Liu et al. 2023)]|nr:FecR domain-containing protein [Novosphingobium album (ex Liu et al. 2023)]
MKETAEAIDQEAANWAALSDRGLSDEERVRLDQWLAGDMRRIGALARAQAIWFHAERAGALGSEVLEADRARRLPVLSRRAALIGSAALAASLAAVVLIPRLTRDATPMTSALGEIRRISLEDGSVMTLDADTRVTVAYTAQARRVTLLSGQAYFEVAHDKARPFYVNARDLVVRAVGTAFSVRVFDGLPVLVLVSEGKVSVSRLSQPRAAAPLLVESNYSVNLLDADKWTPPTPVRHDEDEIGRALSWREGMLSFEGETLGEVVSRFDRYGRNRIVIDDPKLAEERITGLFAANDPKGFATAIAVSLGAQVRAGQDEIHLSR